MKLYVCLVLISEIKISTIQYAYAGMGTKLENALHFCPVFTKMKQLVMQLFKGFVNKLLLI